MFGIHKMFAGVLLVSGVFGLTFFTYRDRDSAMLVPQTAETINSITAKNNSTTTLYYTFNVEGTLHETVRMEKSPSPYFWLNSGAKLIIENGIGKTVEHSLSAFDQWRLRYNFTNPTDTEHGYRPQNVFRLVTKHTWDNLEESIRFKIAGANVTESQNRGGWSGIFLMSRYLDGDNLYYVGIRMDGAAVVKKKHEGRYYTLAIEPFFSAKARYDRRTNPNLLPTERWLGLRSVTRTNDNGSVTIELWFDQDDTGNWERVLTATDTPPRYGGTVIEGPAHAGIRTDFLDVHFDDYTFEELTPLK